MFKKTFPLILFSILLIGCSEDTQETKPITPTPSNSSISSSLSKTYSIKDIILDNEVNYSSKYSFFGDLISFPNPDNNNLLSISNLKEFNSFIDKTSLIDFYDYSITSTLNVNNSIYFVSNKLNNSGIYKLDYEKNSIEKISNFIPTNLAYQNGYIYFINKENKYIYSLNIKTKSIELLSNNKSNNFLISNNFIIYQNLSDNSKLYALKTDKTHNVKLTDVSVDSFIALNNEVLFFDSSNNNILCSLKLSTEKITKYSTVVGQNLKTNSENIYFIGTESPNNLYILNREDLTSELLVDDFINDYYPVDDKIFLELASSLNKVYILDVTSVKK